MKERRGLVYFVREPVSGAVKIGYCATGDVATRLTALNTASPSPLELLAAVPGTPDIERAIHHRFTAGRIRGEWFSPDSGVHEFIATLRDAGLCRVEPRAATGGIGAVDRRRVYYAELCALRVGNVVAAITAEAAA